MWWYQGKEFTVVPDDMFGFVYCITNTLTGRQYIGKKYFTFSRIRTVNKRRRKVRVESDWRLYYGSSTELCGDVAALGAEHFKREIIHLCRSRGECSYREAQEQFSRDVLMYPDQYYNSIIQCRIHRKHVLAPPPLKTPRKVVRKR